MFKKQKEKEDGVSGQRRKTLAVYLTLFAVILVLVVYASRFVLFQPWTARDWIAGTAVDGSLYVAGGRDKQGTVYDEILEIDPAGLKIRDVGRLPSPRFGITVTGGEGSRIYMMGGFDGKTCFDDVLVFDTETRRLRSAARLPSGRAFGGAARMGDVLYYLGGWDGDSLLDEIVSVNLSDGSVRVAGSLPSAREFVTAVSYSGMIYLLGGADSRGEYLADILEIDPLSLGVTARGLLPEGRTRSCAAALPDGIAVAGGWTGRKLNDLIHIRPGAGGEGGRGIEVSVLAELDRGVSDAALAYTEGGLFLLGGEDERFQRQLRVVCIDTEEFNMKTLKFRNFLFW